jgi:hypothetical protein
MRDTIDMAREAGCIPVRHPEYDNDVQVFATPDVLKAFEALVRADEREACAQIAADYGPSRPIVSKNPSSQIVGRWEGEQAASAAIDAAIRAREST